MAEVELRQRLAPILAADVVGYSRLMATDERATVAGLEAARQVFRAAIESHQGRVIDMVGDSVLAVFDSVTGAVCAAIAIQETLHDRQSALAEEQRMRFRIGVHLGDVFEKPDGSIYGDGVNIAARLESLAAAGGVAESDAVEGAVRGKIPRGIRYQGARRVKNMARPVELYAVEFPWQTPGSRRASSALRFKWTTIGALLLVAAIAAELLWTRSPGRRAPDDRSVAVLPFSDLSEGKDQSYFSDGLSEEVIGRLTQIPELRVIARTSSFAFKDSRANAAEIAGRLHVSTLLEGSVRRSAGRVRISAQLIKAADNTYLWSGTYERTLDDVFAIQDEIASAVVAALRINLDHPAEALAAGRYVPNSNAYDQFLRGRQLMRLRSEDYEQRAVAAFEQAVALDQHYAAARSMLAFALSFVAEQQLDPELRRPLMDKALAMADKAVQLGPTEADAYATRGYLRFYVRWDCAGAEADFRRALQLDPNDVPTLTKYSVFLEEVGRSDQALALAQRIKASDPFFAPPWELEYRILAVRGDYAAAENALRHSRSILQLDPNAGAGLARLALLQGDAVRARTLFEKLGNPAHRDLGLALAERALGHAATARDALQAFVAKSPFEYYNLASFYAAGSESDAAFAALERAFETRDPDLLQILADPLLVGLYGDPRFERLLVLMGLPRPQARG